MQSCITCMSMSGIAMPGIVFIMSIACIAHLIRVVAAPRQEATYGTATSCYAV